LAASPGRGEGLVFGFHHPCAAASAVSKLPLTELRGGLEKHFQAAAGVGGRHNAGVAGRPLCQ
jgi:hypothetical protein